ncbi:DUF3102 domain-containing protein [Sinorhizobium medicae]|nr:DUF3102 domain-containing protein [Sinorhizobium medicae]
MADMSDSNRLPVLADEINCAHKAAGLAGRALVRHAIAAGQRLIEAKALVGHGEWEAWLAANCDLSIRTAQKYMKAARNAKNDSGSFLSLRHLIGPAKRRKPAAPVPLDVYLAEQQPLGEGEIRVPLDEIKFRRDLYPRIEISHDVIGHYSRLLSVLPPIEINQRHEIIDGFMRWEAHKMAGAKTIRATVTNVKSDVQHLMFAIERNSRHGICGIDVATFHGGTAGGDG